MISKELLSEVLNKKVIHVWEERTEVTVALMDPILGRSNSTINIYELAHKCKEWAWNNGYIFSIRGMNNVSIEWGLYGKENGFPNSIHYQPSEPEAVFKACEWVLENKDK